MKRLNSINLSNQKIQKEKSTYELSNSRIEKPSPLHAITTKQLTSNMAPVGREAQLQADTVHVPRQGRGSAHTIYYPRFNCKLNKMPITNPIWHTIKGKLVHTVAKILKKQMKNITILNYYRQALLILTDFPLGKFPSTACLERS